MVELGKPAPSSGADRLVGRLLEVDFRNGEAGLYDAAGVMKRIRFPEALAQRVKRVARLHVIVVGQAEYDEQGRPIAFIANDLSAIDSDDFWTAEPLEDMVRRQGVRPIASVEELGSKEFAPHEADELLAELRLIRQ